MTFVFAKKINDCIQMIADTMLTDKEGGPAAIMPGRLKLIILNKLISVGYAGDSDPAQRTLRDLYIDGITDIDVILSRLREATLNPDWDIDFVVASHVRGVELFRIWEGKIGGPLDSVVLGNERALRYLDVNKIRDGEDTPKALFQEFVRVMSDRELVLGSGVGGLPTGITAKPSGHRYNSSFLHHVWKPIFFEAGVTQYEDPADLRTGEWSFHHNIYSPKEGSIPILVAQIPQSRRAYIYSPIIRDDPQSHVILEENEEWVENQEKMHAATKLALDEAVGEIQKIRAEPKHDKDH